MMSPKQKKWLVSIGTTILFLLLLEMALRVQFALHRQAKGFQLDEELGWKTVANCELATDLPGYGAVNFSTVEHGFRRFGDVTTAKKKLLVIGDSYTFAETVNDGEAYFDRLAESLDAEVFAFGCNGYGTLQELMILKQHFAAISPDLVIWQLCENDFVNNSFELECRDTLQSNFMTRPYRVGGKNVSSFPAQAGGALLEHSQLMRWGYRQLFARGRTQYDYSTEANKQLANEAVQLTASLLQEAKSHVGSTPLLAFCNRYCGLYQNAMTDAKILFTPTIEVAIDAAATRGETIDARPRDFHWNRAGHQIVADALTTVIVEYGLLDAGPDSDE